MDASFDKLRKKLFWTIFAIPSISVLVMSIVTMTTTSILYSNSFKNSFIADMSLLDSSFNTAYSQLNAKVSSVKNNKDFIIASEKKDESTLASNLTSLANSDSHFLGASYFYASASISSPAISGCPSESELTKNTGIKAFIEDNSLDYFCSIRNEAIASSYNSYPYNNELGMMSIFAKVRNASNDYIGLLEVDFSSDTVYNDYSKLSEHSYMDNCEVYFANTTNVLKTSSTATFDASLALDFKTTDSPSTQGDYYVMKKSLTSDDSKALNGFFAFVRTPKMNFVSLIMLIGFSILGTIIGLLAIFALVAYYYSKRKALQLSNLSKTMEDEKGQSTITDKEES